MARFYNNKDIAIACPNCKHQMTKADKEDPRKHKLLCRACGSYVLYIASNNYREILPTPERVVTSSGKRFY